MLAVKMKKAAPIFCILWKIYHCYHYKLHVCRSRTGSLTGVAAVIKGRTFSRADSQLQAFKLEYVIMSLKLNHIRFRITRTTFYFYPQHDSFDIPKLVKPQSYDI